MCRGTGLIVIAQLLLLSAGTIRAAGKVIRILDLSDPLPSVFPTHTEKPHYVVAVSSDESQFSLRFRSCRFSLSSPLLSVEGFFFLRPIPFSATRIYVLCARCND